MPGQVQHNSIVKLIEVFNSRFEDLHQSFINYDTTTVDGDGYLLPKYGDCLVLLFLGNGMAWDTAELFTTVRSHSPVKEQYYKGLRGQQMIVNIEEIV